MISIFYKPAFLNTASNTFFVSKEVSYKGHGHLQRVSSMIRGNQIAEYLHARLNPESGYQADICIYVKPHVQRGHDFTFEGFKSYLDIIDGWGLVSLLEKHPEVGVIACSIQDKLKLDEVLNNDVVFIPQHHCNYDREKRTRDGIKTIGMIGTEDAFAHIPKGLEEELKKRGITLLKYSKFFSRQDIIDFYKQIDLQIVWRPYRMKLSNPLKIVNASSFGIPTIAYDESVFKEVEGCYIPVLEMEGFLSHLDMLILNPTLYKEISDRCIKKSEEYHIENVAKLYKRL